MEPLVTVIIPIYNAEKYIEKCLDSVLNQSHKYLEIILVDDGSTDNSFEICKNIEKLDPRVRAVKQKNSGPGVARNYGLNLATGDFVCFIDSDDVFELKAIEKMLEHMDDEYDLIQCRYEKIYSNVSRDVDSLPDEEIILDNVEAMQDYLWNFKPIVRFSAWAKLIRRSVINNLRFPELKNSEDVVFNAYLIDACRKIKYIPDILYYVSMRQGSLSRSALSEEKINASIECSDKIIELIEAKADYKSLLARAYWSKISTLISISKQVYENKMPGWKNIIKRMKLLCKTIDIKQYKFAPKYRVAYLIFCTCPIFYIKAFSIILK